MDYSIGNKKSSNGSPYDESEITYSINIGGRYGKLPPEALVSKFEQTDMGNEEMSYENHARETIMGWNTPDTPGLESDIKRQNYDSKGYLNLLHKGGRGDLNDPAHPEMFLEDTTREPRRIAVDPDMREMAKQNNARMRFVRFYPDADNSITSGHWDNLTQSKAMKYLQVLTKERLRVFTTSRDGRREGMRREFLMPSAVATTADETTYGERVTGAAVVPQRHTTILSNTNISNNKMYNQNTTDHEFAVSAYGEGRRGLYLTKNDRVRQYNQDGEYGTEDKSKLMKSAGILMGELVKSRSVNTRRDGTEGDDHILTQARKSQVMRGDLTAILRDISTEYIDEQAYDAQVRKSVPTVGKNRHDAELTTEDAAEPAHNVVADVLANAPTIMKMYKSVREEGFDRRKNADKTENDEAAPSMPGEVNMARKWNSNMPNFNRRHSEMVADGESVQTRNYKTNPRVADGKQQRKTGQRVAHDWSASDTTQGRKTMLTPRDMIVKKMNNKTESRFLDNTMKERHLAPMGSKYLVSEMKHEDVERIEGKFSA